MLEGGCFCGFVRYVIRGTPTQQTNCHCTICRRVSGAAFVSWFTVHPKEFAFTAGRPGRFASSEHASRSFCPSCGTPLTFQSSRATDEIDVTTCSLDDPERVPPRDHTRVSSQLSWLELSDGLPRFPEARE